MEARGERPDEASLYDRRFLIARPLLQALEQSPCVLLVDEVDRADDEFERSSSKCSRTPPSRSPNSVASLRTRRH